MEKQEQKRKVLEYFKAAETVANFKSSVLEQIDPELLYKMTKKRIGTKITMAEKKMEKFASAVDKHVNKVKAKQK